LYFVYFFVLHHLSNKKEEHQYTSEKEKAIIHHHHDHIADVHSGQRHVTEYARFTIRSREAKNTTPLQVRGRGRVLKV